MTAGFLCYGILFLTDRLQPFFFLSSVVMFGSAYFFNSLINMADYLKKIVKDNIKYVKVSIMCIALVISFSHLIFSSQNISSFGYDITPSWRDAINVINSPAIPNGAVIAAWWDYGHWMNYFNGDKIKVNLDNIQDRPEIIYTVAKAFTHVPGDNCMLGASDMHCPIDEQSLEKAEIEALSYLKPLRSTHILIDSEIMGGIVGGKGQALKVIAGKVPGTGKDIGCMQLVPGCQKNQNGDVTCPIGEESLSFSAIEWQMMKKESWPGKILQSEQVGTRMFVKDDINGAPILHMSALSCGNFYPSAQSPIIYAFMERLFFNDQSLKHVELIHDNGAIVIYKINWEGIPDPEELGLENVLPPLES